MRDIVKALNTKEFSRIKIGIGGIKDERQDLKDFVLQRFSREQLEKLEKVFEMSEEKLNEFLKNK
ncbi:peptidyl-tRNA hydrolase [Clostridium sp. CAG:1219]|nr:peptidyl-tRNA hydrolase [Clostridium sp. CAG:1219]